MDKKYCKNKNKLSYMKWYLKIIIIYILRFILRCLYAIVPIKKNLILFSAHEGKSYKCSPKYIFEYLYNHCNVECEYVWCLNNQEQIPSEYKVKCVKFLSLEHIYYLITSSVIISNVQIEPFLPPRKGRIFINTWHGGGAYKKSSLSASYYTKAHRTYFKIIRNWRAESTDYIISSNSVFSNVMSEFFNVGINKMLPIGMPRNDIFFLPDTNKSEIRRRILHGLHLDDEKFIILYAPTYRGHEREVKNVDLGFDASIVCDIACKRFGKDVILMYRCHMNMAQNYKSLKNAVDVSSYPDMQELLIVADMIITDYSSFIWDYALTFNPGFLYTPDLFEYETDVQFHTPIKQWQYPYAVSFDELCTLILNYEASASREKIKKHLASLGSYETGTATISICDIITRHIES